MKVPFSWLKDYVDIDVSAQELKDKLFSCGFEVEELTYLGEKINNVVTGKITEITPHPDSDHMVICKLDCGAHGKDIQIVTGADNVNVGNIVPVALDGSTVVDVRGTEASGVKKIKKGRLRGVESCGMLCSGEELGINDDFYAGAEVYGILILADNTPVGEDIRPVVGLDDYLFDISVTANRPDCQCVYGIAREVAAVLGKPLKSPDFSFKEYPADDGTDVKVTVYAPDLCPRYIGRYVKDIKIGKSPAWIRKRLALCGIRSISNIVDITNFVLLELGQPMHSFDLDTLSGGEIIVRRADDGEKITTLDDKEFTLNGDNLVICDGAKPVALAGIMGGLNSEITENTKRVYFEAAKFVRDNIRHTSRALGQSSDSSARYEKGVDSYTTYYGMRRALHLVDELGCGTVTVNGRDCYAAMPESKVINAGVSKINSLLGIYIPAEKIVSILKSLSFDVQYTMDEDTLRVTVPAFREDVDGYPDLAEEVIREYGYDNINPTFLNKASVTHGGLNAEQNELKRFKNAVRLQGYMECITYSFFSPKDFDVIHLSPDAPERNAVKIKNPLGEDLSLMRTTLVPNMLANIVRNVRRGNESGRLFEVGHIYIPSGVIVDETLKTLTVEEEKIANEEIKKSLPEERTMVSFGLWGEGDFFDLKGAVEAISKEFGVKFTYERRLKPYLHPGVSAAVMLGSKEVGFIGELSPVIAEEQALDKKVYIGQLDYDAIKRKFSPATNYKGMPRFPAVKRDLAVIVDEGVSCGEIEDTIRRACKAVSDIKLFDVFRGIQVGVGKKSMAFTLTFTPEVTAEKPLSGEQVDGFVKKILGNLSYSLGAKIRE